MAKRKPSAPASTDAPELTPAHLAVEKLTFPFNAAIGRTFDAAHDAADAELLASVRGSGIHLPILVRVDPLDKGLYQVLDGERRARAAIEAGHSAVPALVHEHLTDAEAWEIWYAANYQRKDLTPVQEGEAVKLLLERNGGDVDAVAARLGHPRRWVVQRMSLASLSPAWQEWAASPGCPWGVGHLLAIARLPAGVQADLYEQYEKEPTGDDYNDPWSEAMFVTVAELERTIARDYMHTLSAAPWALDNPAVCGIDPARPACTACPHRTGACGELFLPADVDAADIQPDDRCLDPACWEDKRRGTVNGLLRQIADDGHRTIVLVDGNYGDDVPDGIVVPEGCEAHVHNRWDVEDCKPTAAKALPAIRLDNGKMQRCWVKVKTRVNGEPAAKGKSVGDGKPTPLAERRKTLDRKRAIETLNRLRALVEETTPGEGRAEDLTLPVVASLVAAFGTNEQRKGNGYYPINQEPWDVYGRRLSAAATEEAMAGFLWNTVSPVLASRIEWKGAIDGLPKTMEGEARQIAEIIGVDYDGLAAAVADEMPEPKSWAKLNADGTPKTPKSKGKPKKGTKAQ